MNFTYLFYKHIMFRKSCGNCHFANTKRPSDITIADFENSLQTIEHFVDTEQPTIYFACKALNYRAEKDKWDGDRPLSVYVDWQVKEGKLSAELKFDRPLTIKGNEVGNKLRHALSELHIDANNFEQLKGLLNNDCTIVE